MLTEQRHRRNGTAGVARTERDVPGVTLDAAAGNPFQPSLLYHGFLASPLQGNPQGLAVYLNGARFNQPFGDTVNWDLIPDLAIDRMDLVGSNPVFGLNALGGALSVHMKNGFTYQGGEVDCSAVRLRNIRETSIRRPKRQRSRVCRSDRVARRRLA